LLFPETQVIIVAGVRARYAFKNAGLFAALQVFDNSLSVDRKRELLTFWNLELRAWNCLLCAMTTSGRLPQQVPSPQIVFASNDVGQTRFWGSKTPASKWGHNPL